VEESFWKRLWTCRLKIIDDDEGCISQLLSVRIVNVGTRRLSVIPKVL